MTPQRILWTFGPEGRGGRGVEIFLSWSGQLARDVATVLDTWLPKVVQSVTCWHSDKDIMTGTAWPQEIGKALIGTECGIICVTRENQAAPWLMFEAGALANHQGAHVVPLYVDLQPPKGSSPLDVFQGVFLDEEGTWKLVRNLHERTRSQLPQADIKELFDMMWPSLRDDIEAAKRKTPAAEPQPTANLRDRGGGGVAARQVLDPLAYSRRLRSCAPLAMQTLTEMRLAVEPAAASLAATNASEQQRKTLVRLSKQMEEQARRNKFARDDSTGGACRERFRVADLDFHRTLLEASGNELFHALDGHVELALTYRIQSDRDRDGACTREEPTATRRHPPRPSDLSVCLHRVLALAVARGLPQAAEDFSRAQICEVRPGPLPTLVAQALADALDGLKRRSMGGLSNQEWDPLESAILTAVAAALRA